jgi:hypothetical protein
MSGASKEIRTPVTAVKGDFAIRRRQLKIVRGDNSARFPGGPFWVAARLVPFRALRTKQRTTSGAVRRGDKPFSRGHIYTLLPNRIYAGQIVHKGQL